MKLKAFLGLSVALILVIFFASFFYYRRTTSPSANLVSQTNSTDSNLVETAQKNVKLSDSNFTFKEMSDGSLSPLYFKIASTGLHADDRIILKGNDGKTKLRSVMALDVESNCNELDKLRATCSLSLPIVLENEKGELFFFASRFPDGRDLRTLEIDGKKGLDAVQPYVISKKLFPIQAGDKVKVVLFPPANYEKESDARFGKSVYAELAEYYKDKWPVLINGLKNGYIDKRVPYLIPGVLTVW